MSVVTRHALILDWQTMLPFAKTETKWHSYFCEPEVLRYKNASTNSNNVVASPRLLILQLPDIGVWSDRAEWSAGGGIQNGRNRNARLQMHDRPNQQLVDRKLGYLGK